MHPLAVRALLRLRHTERHLHPLVHAVDQSLELLLQLFTRLQHLLVVLNVLGVPDGAGMALGLPRLAVDLRLAHGRRAAGRRDVAAGRRDLVVVHVFHHRRHVGGRQYADAVPAAPVRPLSAVGQCSDRMRAGGHDADMLPAGLQGNPVRLTRRLGQVGMFDQLALDVDVHAVDLNGPVIVQTDQFDSLDVNGHDQSDVHAAARHGPAENCAPPLARRAQGTDGRPVLIERRAAAFGRCPERGQGHVVEFLALGRLADGRRHQQHHDGNCGDSSHFILLRKEKTGRPLLKNQGSLLYLNLRRWQQFLKNQRPPLRITNRKRPARRRASERPETLLPGIRPSGSSIVCRGPAAGGRPGPTGARRRRAESRNGSPDRRSPRSPENRCSTSLAARSNACARSRRRARAPHRP